MGNQPSKMILSYENEMFLSSMQEDSLTIMAKGLGLENVFLYVVKVHSDPGNRVLVMWCNDREEQRIIQQLEQQVMFIFLIFMLSITAHILLVDFLMPQKVFVIRSQVLLMQHRVLSIT